MGVQLDLEEDIANVIKQFGLKHVFHLKVNAIDVVNVLKLLFRGPGPIIVVLPPDGGDDLALRIKSMFPGTAVITYRSFRLNNDEVLLAF